MFPQTGVINTTITIIDTAASRSIVDLDKSSKSELLLLYFETTVLAWSLANSGCSSFREFHHSFQLIHVHNNTMLIVPIFGFSCLTANICSVKQEKTKEKLNVNLHFTFPSQDEQECLFRANLFHQ